MVVGNFVYIFVAIFGLVALTGAAEGSHDDFMTDWFAKLKTAFPQIDTDGDGKVRFDQFMKLLFAIEPNLSEDNVDMIAVNMLAVMADADNDNMLTLDELINFLTASAGQEPDRASAQEGAAMFKLFDADKNGKISLEELNAMPLQSDGTPDSEYGATGMMELSLQLMDANGDGQLSLEEYVNGAISLTGF